MNLLLIVTDGELQVSWHDTLLFVIASSITGELEDFSRKVFEDSSKVYYNLDQRDFAWAKKDTHQVHQRRHAERSCLASIDDEHDQQGTEGQPLQSAIGIWSPLWRPCQTSICR